MKDKLLAAINKAHEKGDLLKCRTLLEYFCADILAIEWHQYKYKDFNFAMNMFTVLYETDLCNSPEGSSLRVLFLNTTEYVFKNAPPEMQAAFNEGLKDIFPELYATPALYSEEGSRCFTIENMAKAFDTDVDSIIDYIEEGKAAGITAYDNLPQKLYRLQ